MIRDSLSFDDVLLVPQYSEVMSRSDVNVSVKLCKGFRFGSPLIPANMKTIVGKRMINYFVSKESLVFLHRFMPIEEQLEIMESYRNSFNYVGVSIGVKKEDYDNVLKFKDLGVKIFCIDVASGHHKLTLDMCRFINKNCPDALLIAGNTATAIGAESLWDAGADVVKCGVGSSGICLTRVNAGSGVPQLTAIMDTAEVKYSDKFIISDGGHRNPGDCAKSLCFVDMVMCGNIFSGTDECPGDIIEKDGRFYKQYIGSSTYRNKHVEGVQALVQYKGSVDLAFNKVIDGIQSACSYQGVNNLVDLKVNPQLIKITNAGIIESGTHSIHSLI